MINKLEEARRFRTPAHLFSGFVFCPLRCNDWASLICSDYILECIHILGIYAYHFFSALVENELWGIIDTRILFYFYHSVDIAAIEDYIRICFC